MPHVNQMTRSGSKNDWYGAVRVREELEVYCVDVEGPVVVEDVRRSLAILETSGKAVRVDLWSEPFDQGSSKRYLIQGFRAAI